MIHVQEEEQSGPVPQPEDNQEPRKQSLLLRLFESKLFDPALAMNYLFITKEPGVLEYIGNRLFRNERYHY
jgi:phosphatidylinositol 4-kinase